MAVIHVQVRKRKVDKPDYIKALEALDEISRFYDLKKEALKQMKSKAKSCQDT